ncbi:energy transducer TonB [Pedobacter jamesrossensis]|uniref:energy transducer TonB n=1 Tax=Pedobacter jamesrossensis TaxID=1908238 RepID=UPI00360EE352
MTKWKKLSQNYSHRTKRDKSGKNKTQGKVFLSFIVEQTGELTDVEVVRGLTEETNAEAVRVIKESPKWNAGILKGKPVRVKYNIAVNFKQA